MPRFGVTRGLRTVARRWWVVVLAVGLGAMVAAGTAPSAAERLRTERGAATAELVLAPTSDQLAPADRVTQQLALASRVARQPEVSEATERVLRPDLEDMSGAVTVRLDEAAGSVVVTARTGDADASVEVAAAYAAEAARYVAQTTGIALAAIGSPVVVTGAGGTLPSDPGDRGMLGALAGLILGLLLAATVLPGRDGRLHNRRTLERAYATPVLAEIPRIPGRARYAGHVAFLTRPTGTVAEAYRVLRCAVLNRGKQGEVLPRVVAVTSPSRGDGRSSVARNLAAALAESGRRVLLIDCDFGHPTAHYGVGMQPGTGLSDLLAAPESGSRLAEVARPSEVPGVLVLSIGTRGGREPGQLAHALPQVLAVARRMVDVIVIDSEPLDCAGDALDALETADAVLIVARSGRTGRGTAERTADLLERCGTNVAGLVLIGSGRESDVRTPYLISRPDLLDAAPGSLEPEPTGGRHFVPA